ncbi:hypothetical protein KFU94_33530 [Chloroflexi bacterium TSY]|nr:hypothetical protein [Chloroflexi bacterium TSY]
MMRNALIYVLSEVNRHLLFQETGIWCIPRITGTVRQRNAQGEMARRKFGKRRSNVLMAMRLSTRASGAPKQK